MLLYILLSKNFLKSTSENGEIGRFTYRVISADLEMSLIRFISDEKYMLNFHSFLPVLLNMNTGHIFSCYKHNQNKNYKFNSTLQLIFKVGQK